MILYVLSKLILFAMEDKISIYWSD